MKNTLRIAALAAAIAFIVIGCKSPVDDPEPEYGVTGRIAGVVVDNVTGLPIQDVKVTISGEAGYEEWTDVDGTFLIEGVKPGYYAVVYTKEGYEPALIGDRQNPNTWPGDQSNFVDTAGDYGSVDGASTAGGVTTVGTVVPNIVTGNYVYVSPIQYKVDDPFGEWYALQAELAAFTLNGYETFGNSQWTFSEGDNSYTYTSGGGAITANYNTESKTFTFSGSMIGQREYSYGITLGIRPLAPLDAGIQGNLRVVFKGVDNLFGSVREEAPVDGTKHVAEATEDSPEKKGIKVYFQAGDTTNVYGPAYITTADGLFKFEGLPSGKPIKAIYVDGFSQADKAGTIYWFNGEVFNYKDDGTVQALDATVAAGFTTTRPHELSVIGDVYISPIVGDAFISEHNIGVAGSAKPIEVNGAIELTFSKAIEKATFRANFVPFKQNAKVTGDWAGAVAVDANQGPKIPLVATWSTDGTKVTLKAGGKPQDDTPADLDEFAFPYTYKTYADAQLPAGYLEIEGTGRAQDGSLIRLSIDKINVTGLTDVTNLLVYTEPALRLEKTEFLASGTEGARHYEKYEKLPFAGTIKLTFNQALAVNSQTKFEVFELPAAAPANYATTAQIDAETVKLQNAVKVLTIDGTTPKGNDYAIDGNVVTISLDKVLSRTALHVIQYTVYTAKPNGVLKDRYTTPFTTGDDLTLTGTNLYDPANNIYYVAIPANNDPYFGLTEPLKLTFDKDIPAGAKTEAELYYKADAAAATSASELKKANILANATFTVSGKELSISNPGLSRGQEYVLAVKITSASGQVLFNTKSEVFSYYTRANDYTGNVTPYKYSSGLVYIDDNAIDGVKLSDGVTNVKSPYILFGSTGGFTPQQYNIKAAQTDKPYATNIAIAVPTVAGPPVTPNKNYVYVGLNYTGQTKNAVSDNFTGDKSIIIEFTEDLAETGHTAKLYLWNDADANDTINPAKELLLPSTPKVAVAGKVLTIAPDGVLAPDRKFALELTVKSKAGTELYYGDHSLSTDAWSYIVFRVKDEFVVSDPRIKTIAETDITPEFNSLAASATDPGSGTFLVTPIVSGQDNGKKTYGLADVYRAYNLNPVTGKYDFDPASVGKEVDYVDTIYDTIPGETKVSVNAVIPGEVRNRENIDTNLLVKGGKTTYIIRGFDDNGFVYSSEPKAFGDNTPPKLDNSFTDVITGTDTDAGPAAWVQATGLGVIPRIDAHMESQLNNSITTAITAGISTSQDLLTISQDGAPELLEATGYLVNASVRRYTAGSSNHTAVTGINITAAYKDPDPAAGNHRQITLKFTTSAAFGGLQAGDFFEFTGIKDTSGSGKVAYFEDTTEEQTSFTIRFVFQ